jgi:DNA invertase Pin-like site-specific DNA recombinase
MRISMTRPLLVTWTARQRFVHVAFIANLMESGADFVACDMPTANRLTIHILAAVAEHEREMISKRTKAALAEAKRRGTKLGRATRAWRKSVPRHERQTGRTGLQRK